MTDVPPAEPSMLDDMVTAVLDGHGVVRWWSRDAVTVTGRTAAEVCGRPAADLFAGAPGQDGPGGAGVPPPGPALLRHRSGREVAVALRTMRLVGGGEGPEFLLLAVAERSLTPGREGDRAATLVRALLGPHRVGAAILNGDLRVVRANADAPPRGLSAAVGRGLCDLMSPPDTEVEKTALRRVLDTGDRAVGWEERVRAPHAALCLDDATGRAAGVVVLYMDPMGKRRRRRHYEARYQAAIRIGRSLDVVGTAEDLVDVLLPSMADLVSVSLAEAVLRGDDPPAITGGGDQHQRRGAVGSSSGPWPATLLPLGAAMPPLPDSPETREVQHGGTIMVSDREAAIHWLGDPELVRAYVPEDGHSVAVGPLFARGLLLGMVLLWRTGRQPETFTDEDVELLREIVSRAAIAVDNARRYRREHRAATALQQRLLPRATRDTPGAETVGGYVPAGGGAGIGGDWFDVIPLPSLRVALVVGDVIGHGLHATATMGRLRTAVQTLADLELDPGELLTHLDDLVQRLAAEAAPRDRDSVGGTLLYAVYDPVTHECAMASAGHPAPVLLRPDGATELVPLDPGPLLGVGGMPFEVTETRLEPGTVLALHTNGLTALHGPDTEAGTRRVTRHLAALGPGAPLDTVVRELLAGATDPPRRDDVTLLLARGRGLGPDTVADWDVASDPASLAEVRRAVTGRVVAWGLEALSFTTELIVSELVTNAIRHAEGPYRVRLIRDHVLVTEVSDRSNTQPRMRRARVGDEGGRGLFLVAQLAERWGSRYGHAGKTVWAEQPLPHGAAGP
ncbi:ATP-binding SpoIIE family protein phosphatase [Streptomyces specialis]|uniref:ATP-binding SpoIIE family protein phosphatase n=1 Tax=Streptomyces specialis TaxID=498367 RepID=UPI000A92550E|nr:SpoIIE family protein phosphatase [Streptomyces specialis]